MVKKAKDIMTANPIFIPSGADLKEAVHLFFSRDLHAAPVVNPLGETLGFMGELGLLKSVLKHHFEKERTNRIAHHSELFDEPTYVNEDDSLGDVIRCMIKAATHRVLVQNKKKQLVGIISPKDVLRFVTGETARSTDLKDQLEKSRTELSAMSKQITGLQETVDRYKKLVEESPYMLHSVDANGRIVMANKKIHEVLGYNPGELVGRSLSDLYPESVRGEAYHGLTIIMEKGYHQTTYTTMLRKNGEKVRVDLASGALKDSHGTFLGTITISREVDSDLLLRALNGVLEKEDYTRLLEKSKKDAA